MSDTTGADSATENATSADGTTETTQITETTAPATDSEGTEKAGGLGGDGTIPATSDGIAAGVGDEQSNFNPEEDPDAAADAN
ncbi:hypothetical protein [Marisediminicola senii]|uniref:hypothetical protein n=1 Tax=Marisediminicola senii TaxID=2711233 RepID=UPI0013EB79AD|nr:hypothetical protein [Marisediminicola senii]